MIRLRDSKEMLHPGGGGGGGTLLPKPSLK